MDRADRSLLGLALAMAAALACGDPIQVTPIDAAVDMDGTATPMADAATSGLRLRWSTSPRIPGDFSDDGISGTLARADFDLRNIRVAGDVGTLQAAALDLRFRGDPEVFEMGFGQAQPGIYGTFATEVAHLDIRGTLQTEKGPLDYRIVDDPPQGLDVTAALGGVVLGAGQLVTIDIEIDVGELIPEIDWELVEEEDGELRIDSSSPLVGEVREGLAEAFRKK